MVTMSPVHEAERTDAQLTASAVANPAVFAAVFDRHYAAIHGCRRAREAARRGSEFGDG